MERSQTIANKQEVKNSTSLSSYVWDLKEKNDINPTLKWSIIKHVKSYTSNARNCSLCLQEKFEILFYPIKNELLNKRSEMITKCRHMNKFMLANYKSKDWFYFVLFYLFIFHSLTRVVSLIAFFCHCLRIVIIIIYSHEKPVYNTHALFPCELVTECIKFLLTSFCIADECTRNTRNLKFYTLALSLFPLNI